MSLFVWLDASVSVCLLAFLSLCLAAATFAYSAYCLLCLLDDFHPSSRLSRLTILSILSIYMYSISSIKTMHVGRGGALVESIAFNRRIVGSIPALTATYTDPGQVLNLKLPVALQRETPAQYPCCVGSASE